MGHEVSEARMVARNQTQWPQGCRGASSGKETVVETISRPVDGDTMNEKSGGAGRMERSLWKKTPLDEDGSV